MYSFFKRLSPLLVLFLLLKCGEPTPPELPSKAQIKMLLSTKLSNSWKKVSLIDKALGLEIAFKDSLWTFFSKDDTLTFTYNKDFHNTDSIKITGSNYSISQREGISYLNLYNYILSDGTIRKDTLKRIITYITDKEFTTETTDSLSNPIRERFLRKE